jgi:hypothetical protein
MPSRQLGPPRAPHAASTDGPGCGSRGNRSTARWHSQAHRSDFHRSHSPTAAADLPVRHSLARLLSTLLRKQHGQPPRARGRRILVESLRRSRQVPRAYLVRGAPDGS